MGSGRKITRSKRPQRIRDSGEPCPPDSMGPTGDSVGGGSANSDPTAAPGALLVSLVRIDAGVLRRAHIGNPVTLRMELTRIMVLLGGSRLGDVAPGDSTEVRRRGATQGVVEAVEHGPGRVRILVE
jgi:hypothetical protein